MAIRYSGEVTIRMTYREATYGSNNHNGDYRCVLSRVINRGTAYEKRVSEVVFVGAPIVLSCAVDSTEAYDSTAKSAISFSNSEASWEDHCAYTDTDVHVGTSLLRAWPKEKRSRGLNL